MPGVVELLPNTVTYVPGEDVVSEDCQVVLANNATFEISGGGHVVINSFVGIFISGLTFHTTFSTGSEPGYLELSNVWPVEMIGLHPAFTYEIGKGGTISVDQYQPLSYLYVSGATIDFGSSDGSGCFILKGDSDFIGSTPVLAPMQIVNIHLGDRIELDGATGFEQVGNKLIFSTIANTYTFIIPEGATYSYDTNTETLTFTSCFLRGTRIRTPDGDMPVEELRVGDLVATHRGASEIIWIGRRMIDPKGIDKPHDTLPIRIKADSIAENVPERDLLISPDHCMFFEQALIPTKFLINGTTITQETMLDRFEYYHIELAQHSIVLAEGAQTETYLDLGDRLSFLEPGVLRFGAFGAEATRTWDDWCFPPVYAGAVLEKVQHALEVRAEQLGYVIEDAKAS
ncbi:hypothetical protein A6U86_30820 [Rhizobium sp. AC27/96]|uniref:Hint domain-containing protein n=1 Tax=Rhizobium sp. AC27/96 TaxID=1841653 RepID=UPI0008286183|nr:Hint domain-containing protein [Rhizobium sp. AC27/96]OCJ03510.1 hypothetical protein A6U86_30820 [Rhizobium sp. AC27/96]